MAQPKTFAVVTTIQGPTDCMRALAKSCSALGFPILVFGDKKGPVEFKLDNCEFRSLADQQSLPFTLAGLLPVGHYCRKNLGYLEAMQRGAGRIFETDDDNAPNEHFGSREIECDACPIAPQGWCNVYRLFSGDSLIWPRGLPLDHVRGSAPVRPASSEHVSAPIQQGLADGAPDVDAIWRLLVDKDFSFDRNTSVMLKQGAWCPFNSQNTWWFPVCFPLMYLPSFCSFRMTDIWRSFIAQRCLWELSTGVVFHSADVVQDRNPHNLMRDFSDEVPGYTRNSDFVAVLGALSLKPGPEAVADNLLACYQELVAKDFFPEKELPLVKAWLHDVRTHCTSTL